jgi:hypothetical protein
MPPMQGPGSFVASIHANRLTVPEAEICTMVVPVPCRFALLLKLLTRIFPWTSDPVVVGTMATPYGFTSPLLGTVEATTLRFPASAWTAKKEMDAIVSRHRFLTRGECIRQTVFIVFSWSVIERRGR